MKRKSAPASYEILTVPFAGLNDQVGDDDLLDLGELGENEFRGMASVFGRVVDAFTPTIMQRGAFTKTLTERSRNIPILFDHDMRTPIGKPIHLFESEAGLVLQARISRTTVGRDALILMRDGVMQALSIGFEPVVFDFEESMDAEGFKTRTRFVREARLVEISVVTLGADSNALITEVRSGMLSGSLERYQAGHGVIFGDTNEEPTEELEADAIGTESLSQKLEAFSAEYLANKTDASDLEITEAFAATLHQAEPSIETLTLADVEHQLQLAELLAAELDLESL